jgi:hypothetical protein
MNFSIGVFTWRQNDRKDPKSESLFQQACIPQLEPVIRLEVHPVWFGAEQRIYICRQTQPRADRLRSPQAPYSRLFPLR